MQAKMIIFPNDAGFSVLIWESWSQRAMRVRRFDNRMTMIALLESLQLLDEQQVKDLQNFGFIDSCPLYSVEVEEDTLVAHAFQPG